MRTFNDSGILVSDLVRSDFRPYGGNGTVGMIECYFDDSGTHAGSKIIVWGGLIGTAEKFDLFSQRWNELLKAPLPGRKPLKKMSLAGLRRGRDEFFGYSQGEKDLLTKKFRDIIVEAGLECIAYIVVADDWLAASTPIDRMYLGDARNFAFWGALEAISGLANLTEGGLSCHFDKGAQDDAMRAIQAAWEAMRPAEGARTSFTYSTVESLAGLQGADMVAHEAFHYGLHLLNPSEHPENPHFVDLRKRTSVAFLSLHEAEMRQYLERWRAEMTALIASLSGGVSE